LGNKPHDTAENYEREWRKYGWGRCLFNLNLLNEHSEEWKGGNAWLRAES
jgi:hypothetical protein